ncbi:MAG: hypothetical protein AAF202_14140, partial [Pseudomonadota bacterium]
MDSTGDGHSEQWLASFERALSCAWQMSSPLMTESEGRSCFADFHSDQRAGFNLDLSITIDQGLQKTDFTVQDLKQLSQHWDHAVLNEVFVNQLSSPSQSLSAEKVSLLIYQELAGKLSQREISLESFTLGVTRDFKVQIEKSSASLPCVLWRLPFQSALDFSIMESAQSTLEPFSGYLWLGFQGEILAPHGTIVPYDDIRILSQTWLDEVRGRPVNKILEARTEGEIYANLLSWFQTRSPALSSIEFVNLANGRSSKCVAPSIEIGRA